LFQTSPNREAVSLQPRKQIRERDTLKSRILLLVLLLSSLHLQADVIDSLLTQSRDSIGLASDSLVLRFLQESGVSIYDNNKVKLLKSGREKFIDLFAAIRKAKHHVHLEYF